MCKICQQKLTRKNNEYDMIAITNHLKREHGVVSGDQIITGTECDLGENWRSLNKLNMLVYFSKGASDTHTSFVNRYYMNYET